MAIVNKPYSAKYLSRAIAKALPSAGSVPAPTSSNRIKELTTSVLLDFKASIMRLIRRICPENVDKLCCKDCSSPISANTTSNQGNSTGSFAGTNIPAFAISAAKPIVLRVTVLPPVLGPVIATTLVSGFTNTSMGTTSAPSSWRCCQTNRG